MAKFSDFFGVLSVKDPEFGAEGDGVTDDTTAIQSCFDAAFGHRSAPHGNAGKFTNRAVYFPPGNYITTAPLTLFDVVGGHIFGSAENSTRISYTGALTGNDVTVSTGGADDITPVIITNGFGYSHIENLTLAIGGADTTCFYLYDVGGGSTQNQYTNVTFEGSGGGVTAGVLVGFQSGGACSEQHFYNCYATIATYGFRVIGQNVLNIHFYGCSATDCTTGISIPTGTAQIYGGSFADNGVDIVPGQDPVTVIGTRTESTNFFGSGISGVPHVLSGCCQTEVGGAAGYFATVAGPLIIDGCVENDTNSTSGVIAGSSGTVYLRGNTFLNTSYLSGFTGTVGALDIPVGLVSALPSAATKYKGLRAVVTDATVTTFASTVAGTGGNIVPVYCDGTNWKIG